MTLPGPASPAEPPVRQTELDLSPAHPATDAGDPPAGGVDEAGRAAESRRFDDVIGFVAEHLAPLICRRRGGGRVWCDQWWRHPEAYARLTELWNAWEALRTQGGSGLSSWWVRHFDPTWRALTDGDTGPFHACKDGHTNHLAPLAHQPPAPGWLEARDEGAQDEWAEQG